MTQTHRSAPHAAIEAPTLFQFRYAMFPEKARWALDYCGIEYKAKSLLPGPHVPIIATKAGQKTVPVLQTNQGLLKSSSAIMEWAHQQNPDIQLYGANEEQADLIKKLVAQYDEVGIHARRAYFDRLLQDIGYAADLFSTGSKPVTQAIYRAAFPGIKAAMKIDMNIWPKPTARSLKIVETGLDMLAEHIKQGSYLVGDQFSAADLTAATVLGVCVLPDEYPITLHQPYPKALQNWLDRWQDHPGAAWVKTIYARHRPKPLAISDI